MKQWSRLVAAVLGCGVFLLAHAIDSRWMRVATSQSNSWYVDTERLSRRGEMAEYWLVTNWYQPQLGPRAEYSFHSMMTLEEANCARLESRTKHTVTYKGLDGEGAAISVDATPNTVMEPVIPNSAGEQVLKIACLAAQQLASKAAPIKRGR